MDELLSSEEFAELNDSLLQRRGSRLYTNQKGSERMRRNRERSRSSSTLGGSTIEDRGSSERRRGFRQSASVWQQDRSREVEDGDEEGDNKRGTQAKDGSQMELWKASTFVDESRAGLFKKSQKGNTQPSKDMQQSSGKTSADILAPNSRLSSSSLALVKEGKRDKTSTKQKPLWPGPSVSLIEQHPTAEVGELPSDRGVGSQKSMDESDRDGENVSSQVPLTSSALVHFFSVSEEERQRDRELEDEWHSLRSWRSATGEGGGPPVASREQQREPMALALRRGMSEGTSSQGPVRPSLPAPPFPTKVENAELSSERTFVVTRRQAFISAVLLCCFGAVLAVAAMIWLGIAK